MKKLLKLFMIVLMIFGLTFSAMNFLSIENTAAGGGVIGTYDPATGECVGPPLNCSLPREK